MAYVCGVGNSMDREVRRKPNVLEQNKKIAAHCNRDETRSFSTPQFMPIVAFDDTPREPMPGRRDLLRGTLSEFVAMTLFVFFGCGAAASNAHFSDGDWDPASVTVIALQFGLAITVLVYATAHTSGGHVNAAVTLGLTVSGKCHPIRGAAYFIAQMLGSIAGAAILKGATHGDAGGEDLDRSGSLGSNGLQNASVNLHNAVAFEFVGTLVPHARGPETVGELAMPALFH